MSAKAGDAVINELSTFFLTRDAWQNWTPTIDQGGAVARTINYAKYVAIGNTVILSCFLACTAAGVGGNAIIVAGLPFAAVPPGVIGHGEVIDVSVGYYVGAVNIYLAATQVAIFSGAGAAVPIGANPSFALANGDVISFTAIYER